MAERTARPIDETPAPLDKSELTLLLERVGEGDASAADRLFPLVYHELRALAGAMFQGQSPGHTLQPTALVHDVYLKLVDQTGRHWSDRKHFFAVAARAMRQVLTDHARRQRAAKRGGHGRQLTLQEDVAVTSDRSIDLVGLDEALDRLTELDERKCRVIELRFFGGLSNEAVAEVLGVSRTTVADDWTVARAWLRSELSRGDAL